MGDDAEIRRLQRKTADTTPTALVLAVVELRRRCSGRWARVAAALGVPSGTVRAWLYSPPRRNGRAVAMARAQLERAGLLAPGVF